MSPRTDGAPRRGTALLLAIVTASLVGIATLALWRLASTSARHSALEQARPGAEALVTDVMVRTLARVDEGAWRGLVAPGTRSTFSTGSAAGATWAGEVGRSAWSTLVVRARAAARTGVPGVQARAEQRIVIPLVPPLALPDLALTGGSDWVVEPGALIELPPPVGSERTCRSGRPVGASGRGRLPEGIERWSLVPVDPDTVRDSLVGTFRLTRPLGSARLRVTGMLVTDTDLLVGADLRVTGVLIAGGSIRTAGGHLDVAGAVMAGDSGGGQSRLGAGDRVRYDACAIRGAVLPLTRPGPAATWTTLRLF